MERLKKIAVRGAALAMAVGFAGAIGASYLPNGLVSADSLNPLTKRSLTLSSSSPGWSYTDGSGNSTYAMPNSGANGQKTGESFAFDVSSNATIKAFTFQYCTRPAGECRAPGDNTPTAGAGTITTDSSSTAVTGVGTAFNTDFAAGSKIMTAGGNVLTVATVTDATNLTLTANAPATETGVTYTFPSADTATTSDLNVKVGSPAEISGTETAGAGTITTTVGSTAVVGVGTTFLTSVHPGDRIKTAGGNFLTVYKVTDDTNLVLTSNATVAESGVTYSESDFYNVVNNATGEVHKVPQGQDSFAGHNTIPGNFVVFYDSSAGQDGTEWTQSTGWTMSASNQEEDPTSVTGKDNYITLKNATGQALAPGQRVKVVFFGTDSNYITNPGSAAFFVKINDYNSDATQDSTTLVDGGVTVANVMNFSIAISTKVLETMDFSVGTIDPDMLTSAELTAATGSGTHGSCNPIVRNLTAADANDTTKSNVLKLGSPTAEYSLATDTTYATHSYWRLSSNASAGATVYYSGVTLSNTEGDQIAPAGYDATTDTTTAVNPITGTEQFGLALATGAATDYNTDYSVPLLGIAPSAPSSLEYGADQSTTNYPALDSAWTTMATNGTNGAHKTQLGPLAPEPNYALGAGVFDRSDPLYINPLTTKYAFDPNSNLIPTALASENNQVVNCVTAKVRYIGNIAATTPAGIYTTKINYIAAPQY